MGVLPKLFVKFPTGSYTFLFNKTSKIDNINCKTHGNNEKLYPSGSDISI